jgi:hypothetical protein
MQTMVANPKINAKTIYSITHENGTIYYISLHTDKLHSTVDKAFLQIEKEIQQSVSHQIFKRFGMDIVRSCIPKDDALYTLLFDIKKKIGKAHQPNSNVSVYSPASETSLSSSILETTPSSTPSYTPEMTPSPVQRADSTTQVQGSMPPEPDESTVINMYFHSYIFLLTAPSFCRDPAALNNAWSSSAKANANPTSKNSLPRTRMPQSFSARITEKEPCMLL